MPPVLRKWGRQQEQSEEVSDQISTGRQNPVHEELDPAAGSTGGSVADNRVEVNPSRMNLKTHNLI